MNDSDEKVKTKTLVDKRGNQTLTIHRQTKNVELLTETSGFRNVIFS